MQVLYLGALILGGIVLGASIVFGGDHEGPGEHHVGHPGGETVGSAESLLITFLTARFWTFFLAFFGLTGLVLGGLSLVESPILTAVLAVVMGFGAGTLATQAIRRLSRKELSSAVQETDYVGRTGSVLVAIAKDAPGKVRLQIKGNTVDMVAMTEDGERFEPKEEVLVISVEGTAVRVARAT